MSTLCCAAWCAACNKPWFGLRLSGGEGDTVEPSYADADNTAIEMDVEQESASLDEVGGTQVAEIDGDTESSADAVTYRERLLQGAIGSDMIVVNGEAITVQDVLDPIQGELERAAASMSVAEYGRLVQEAVATQIWRQINERLVYQEAVAHLNERMTGVLDAEADRVLRERINREFDGRQTRFERHLAESGKSIEEVRGEAKRRLLVADYLRKKFESQVPESTRSALWQYYQSHVEDFSEASETELLLIDIRFGAFVEDASSRSGSADWLRSKEHARVQADAAWAELESGMSFDAVARTYSKGIHASDGGAWGVIGSSGLVGRYREVTDGLAGLEAHQHTGVIEGSDAYFIVGAGQVREARVQSFETAQERIKEILRREGMSKLEREYLEELRERANVQRWREFQLEVMRAIPAPGQGGSGELRQ